MPPTETIKESSAETDLKNREIRIQEQQYELRKTEVARARWNNAMTVGILSIALAGFTNAGVLYYNSKQDDRKAEQARLLEALKAPPDKASENLQFLLDMGLIEHPELASRLAKSLQTRLAGEGPSLGYKGYTDGGSYKETDYGGFKNPNVDIVRSECAASACTK